jgi:two-component system NtrC family sensor kinase
MTGAVLVVDDSLTVRMDLVETLEAAGIAVMACATADEARRALAEDSFSLVILDVLLPDADGIELLQEIRATPSAGETAVMLLSTEAEVRHRVRGLTTGADDYIGKPYEPSYLLARARELLRRGETAPQPGQETILIIDDSVTFREALRGALEGASYRAITAATGEEGLRMAADVRPSAILVDSELPGIDGAAVVRRIRLDAALRRTPCLLLTASDGPDSEIEALEAGADSFVRKEEDLSVVVARLAAVLRHADMHLDHQGTASLSSSKKVLAVDDSETYLQELAHALRSDGYDVVLARSGKEALAMLEVQMVDCVLLDLVMPDISGLDACRHIKSSPDLRDIPVVMLTARDDREAVIGGLEAGADDHIAKSSDFHVLRARVQAQIRRKQFEDENRRIREHMLRKELEAAEARAARELAETRARLVDELERKNAELIAASEAKDRFLATMSHELRTPLNAVIGFTGALQMKLAGPLNVEQEQQLRTVRSSAEHLLALINDLLDLAKIEAGKVELMPEPVLIQEVVRTVVNTVRPLAASKSLEFDVDMPDDDLVISVNRRAFSQILLNLANNATKYTKTGSVRLVVSPVDAEIEVALIDTGIGIRDDDKGKLFQAFSRVRDSQVAKIEGTGLGLHLSQMLAQMMGGRIDCVSDYGVGSTFTLYLPRERRL